MGSKVSEMRTVQAVETAFDIVEFLQREDGAPLHEIAEGLGLAESTTYHHLNTLTERRYVIRTGDIYYPGLEFLQVGGKVRKRTRVNRISESFVEALAEETGEQMQFIVEENGFGYHVYTAVGERATSIDTRPGKRIYLHANGAGKTILAFSPDEKVESIIEDVGLPALTKHTITDQEDLFRELDQIQEQGYAYNLQEHVEGWGGVSVPVHGKKGILGSLAFGGPIERMENKKSREDLTQTLLEAANEFELELKFNEP